MNLSSGDIIEQRWVIACPAVFILLTHRICEHKKMVIFLLLSFRVFFYSTIPTGTDFSIWKWGTAVNKSLKTRGFDFGTKLRAKAGRFLRCLLGKPLWALRKLWVRAWRILRRMIWEAKKGNLCYVVEESLATSLPIVSRKNENYNYWTIFSS